MKDKSKSVHSIAVGMEITAPTLWIKKPTQEENPEDYLKQIETLL